jgi:hypothetical protein
MPDRFAYELDTYELPGLASAVNSAEANLRSTGHPTLADRLLKAYGVLIRDLEYLAASVAGSGTVALIEHERSSRVRPNSLGGGGPRLEDFLQCDPIPEIPGAVGIANEDLLDTSVPWWPTNEEGSSARVGGHIFGLFYDSGFSRSSAPDPGQFRQHALFEPTAVAGSGPGVIEAPIPARHFVRDSIPAIEARWQRGFREAKAKFDDELTGIFASAALEKTASRLDREL